MRISDWSSDVCSSDLHRHIIAFDEDLRRRAVAPIDDAPVRALRPILVALLRGDGARVAAVGVERREPEEDVLESLDRRDAVFGAQEPRVRCPAARTERKRVSAREVNRPRRDAQHIYGARDTKNVMYRKRRYIKQNNVELQCSIKKKKHTHKP